MKLVLSTLVAPLNDTIVDMLKDQCIVYRLRRALSGAVLLFIFFPSCTLEMSAETIYHSQILEELD